MASRLGVALALAFTAAAILSTSYWRETYRALRFDGMSYPHRRIAYAFWGIPADQIRQALDQILPPQVPIALSDRLLHDGFSRQRLTESLYPRVLDQKSPLILDTADFSPQTSDPVRILARDSKGIVFLLRGVTPRTAQPAPIVEDFSFSWISFLGATISAVGFGILVLTLLCDLRSRPPLFFLWAVPAGAIFLAWSAVLATWLQVRIPWKVQAMAGVLLFLIGLCKKDPSRDREGVEPGPEPACLRAPPGIFSALPAWVPMRLPLEAWRREWLSSAKFPENWVLLGILTLYLSRVARFPIAGWDGRSIWLFHARQLFLSGMFSRADLLRPDYDWSHPDYPVLFPAWLAHFTSLGGTYNERLAGLGIPILLFALVALLWGLLRSQIGRWPGAAVTLVIFFGVETLTAGGFVDGILMLLLLVEFAAFVTIPHRSAAWVAAAAAAHLKFEGFFLAILIALVASFFHGGLPERRRWRRWALPAAIFLTPLHLIWTRTLGLQTSYSTVHRIQGISDLFSRSSIIAGDTLQVMRWEGYFWGHPLLWEGLAALVLAAAGAAAFKCGRAARSALMIVAGSLLFTFLVFLLTPYDLHAQVSTSADRLLLHPAGFSLLALFLLLRNDDSEKQPAAKNTPRH
ncbi:MAG: hypothetical protein HY315_05515 [Acidobacteria bacterium]|nr:hypothetical protein [Acidobacteriota bacterium]